MEGNTGTTYDGATPALSAQTAVVPGSVIDLYFSIQDLGDSVYDSAVLEQVLLVVRTRIAKRAQGPIATATDCLMTGKPMG